MNRKQKTLLAVTTAAAVTGPVAQAASATTPKKKVVTKSVTVSGSEGFAGRWGNVRVTLVVKKTTTTVGKRSTVTRRITAVNVPEYPNHTDRSVFINQQALPMLVQETLQAQFNLNGVQLIGNATDTSQGFVQSLQAALLSAKKA